MTQNALISITSYTIHHKHNEMSSVIGICMHDTVETAFYTVYVVNMYQKISGTSGKNHFHKMNGNVGMAEWK